VLVTFWESDTDGPPLRAGLPERLLEFTRVDFPIALLELVISLSVPTMTSDWEETTITGPGPVHRLFLRQRLGVVPSAFQGLRYQACR